MSASKSRDTASKVNFLTLTCSSRRINGFVVAWAMLKKTVTEEGGEEKEVEAPAWKIAYDEGGEEEVNAVEAVDAVLCSRAFQGGEKIEEDSDIWSYHNNLGKFVCARRGDTTAATISPLSLGKDLKKREIEINHTLKALIDKGAVPVGDPTQWRSGDRDAWVLEFSAALKEVSGSESKSYVMRRRAFSASTLDVDTHAPKGLAANSDATFNAVNTTSCAPCYTHRRRRSPSPSITSRSAFWPSRLPLTPSSALVTRKRWRVLLSTATRGYGQLTTPPQ